MTMKLKRDIEDHQVVIPSTVNVNSSQNKYIGELEKKLGELRLQNADLQDQFTGVSREKEAVEGENKKLVNEFERIQKSIQQA